MSKHKHHSAPLRCASQDCTRRSQLIEHLHGVSCDHSQPAAVRCYVAGACEALDSSTDEPADWQIENLDDEGAFTRGWRDVRKGSFKLTLERFAA
jgi:hypothetical protein